MIEACFEDENLNRPAVEGMSGSLTCHRVWRMKMFSSLVDANKVRWKFNSIKFFNWQPSWTASRWRMWCRRRRHELLESSTKKRRIRIQIALWTTCEHFTLWIMFTNHRFPFRQKENKHFPRVPSYSKWRTPLWFVLLTFLLLLWT